MQKQHQWFAPVPSCDIMEADSIGPHIAMSPI